MLDISFMIQLIVYGMIGMMILGVMMPVIMWILGTTNKHFIDRPVDITGNIMKKLIRGGRQNKRGVTQASWLWCSGEADYYDFKYAKVMGIYSGKWCDIITFKSRRFSPTKLAIIPRELIGDKHRAELRVKANGFMPTGPFYIPMFTSVTSQEDITRFLMLIYRQWDWHMQNEKIYESFECGGHAMSEALDIGKKNWDLINREDYVPKVPGQEGGQAYDARSEKL